MGSVEQGCEGFVHASVEVFVAASEHTLEVKCGEAMGQCPASGREAVCASAWVSLCSYILNQREDVGACDLPLLVIAVRLTEHQRIERWMGFCETDVGKGELNQGCVAFCLC